MKEKKHLQYLANTSAKEKNLQFPQIFYPKARMAQLSHDTQNLTAQ